MARRHGLVTNTTPCPTRPITSAASGKLIPLPGTVSGYYVARARVIDQSGNQSDPTDPNSQRRLRGRYGQADGHA